MKTLLVYYSFSGNNEVLAKELQRLLDCEVYKITELKSRGLFRILLDIVFGRSPEIYKKDISLSRYDHIVLAAPIWAGKIASPLKTFLKMERGNFKAYSFISLCGGRGNKKIADELTKLTQKKPVAITELPVNDLLPSEKKDKIKYTSGYQVQQHDIKTFQKAIESFLHTAVGYSAVSK